MADYTLRDVARFPQGTEVDAYLADGLSHADIQGAPPRSIIDTQTMGSASLTFTGLDPRARYIAHAEVGGLHRYSWFTTGQPDFVTAGVLYASEYGGAPDPGLGDDGDFYFDHFNAEMYGPKADGAWPAPVSIMGPAGPAGEGAGHDIYEEGVELERRTILNFVGAAVTAADNAGATRTDVTVDAPTTAQFVGHTGEDALSDEPHGLPPVGSDGMGWRREGGALVAVAMPSQADLDAAVALLAPLDSPALAGSPTAPTPSAGDSDTSIATTAFVTTAVEEVQSQVVPQILESDATAVQALTTSFVAMKQADDATDSSLALTNGRKYMPVVIFAVERAVGTTARNCDYELRRADGTVLMVSGAGGNNAGRASMTSGGPDRTLAQGKPFTSDGTAVKLYVKVDSISDTPALRRATTCVLLYDVTT